jgi:pimeloyl-ACP methyl ester carboxylesterase
MPRLARALSSAFGFAAALLLTNAAADDAATSKFTKLDDIKVHYVDKGTGDDALVFIHGWSCDASVWNRQVDSLSRKMRAIAIDLPGHGESDKPKIAYTMDLYARAIDAVLEDAQIKRAVIVAHSNGVPAARQFYRKFPEKTLAFVVVDGPLRPLADAATMNKFIEPLRHLNYEDFRAEFVAKMVEPIKDVTLRKEIKIAMLRPPQHVIVSEFEGAIDPSIWQADKINVPTLVILAKQPAWSGDYEQFVRDLAPTVDYQVWQNVSHFIMMERPEEFNDALLAFLTKNNLLPH